MILSTRRWGRQGMKETAWRPPVWLLGLCNLPIGIYGAVTLVTLPQLLAANAVPESQIASVTAIGLIPSFSAFLLAPILDWRFSRRFYAIVLAGLTALFMFAALLSIVELGLLTLLMFLGSATVILYVAAIGGWFGSFVSAEEKNSLGAWFAAVNMGGGGFAALLAIYVLRELP